MEPMSRSGAFPMPPELEERLQRLGHEFLADFLGRSLARHPDNFEALTELANLLTRLGRLEEGLAADQRLVHLAPRDPTVHYNLACSLALLGRGEEALDALERAIALGYRDTEHLLGDEDLASVRASARFQTLLASLRSAE
jgi:Flp pilus assembly protein TadD